MIKKKKKRLKNLKKLQSVMAFHYVLFKSLRRVIWLKYRMSEKDCTFPKKIIVGPMIADNILSPMIGTNILSPMIEDNKKFPDTLYLISLNTILVSSFFFYVQVL